jgi:predicted dehydrogenase
MTTPSLPSINALVVGGGMISAEVILPTLFQSRKEGKISDILIATRRVKTVQELRKQFPNDQWTGYPEGNDPEKSEPDCYKAALKQLKAPGVVIVATPDHLHTPVIIDSLNAGFDVIVQKPLCLKVSEAHQIAKLAKEKNLYVYTDYHKRHDKAVRAAKYKFSKGELGEMLCGHAWIEERREMPLKNFALWAAESSSFEYIGCHYVDAYHFITGLKPKKLVGFAQSKLLPKLGKKARDAGQVTIVWEDDSVLYVQTSWVLPDSNPNLTNQGIQLTGTEGEYRADHADRNSNFVTQSGGFQRYNPHFLKPYNDWDKPSETIWVGYGGESVTQPIDDVRRLCSVDGAARKKLLEGYEQTRPLPTQAMIGTAVNEAFRLSVQNGSKWVSFDKDMYPKLAE